MVFVTGGTGLIGGHLICRLLQDGQSVRGLVRPGSDRSWFYNLADLLLGNEAEPLLKNLEWVEGDLTDVIALEAQISGCSQVYHAAAMVSFAKSDKAKLFQTNVIGTQNLFNVCLSLSTPPDVCYVSSTATIGRVNEGSSSEVNAYSKEHKTSYYGYTKYLSELEAYRARAEGLRVAIVNPCIVLGYGNWNRGSLGIIKKAASGFPFYTEGGNAFVDARDVAAVCVKLLDREVFEGRYLCIGHNARFRTVFDLIAERFDAKKPRIRIGRFESELAWRLAGVLAFFTGKGLITRDSARSGQRVTTFDGSRLYEAIGHNMHALEDTIAFAHKGFQAHL